VPWRTMCDRRCEKYWSASRFDHVGDDPAEKE
jgi:hypothetical protein